MNTTTHRSSNKRLNGVASWLLEVLSDVVLMFMGKFQPIKMGAFWFNEWEINVRHLGCVEFSKHACITELLDIVKEFLYSKDLITCQSGF